MSRAALGMVIAAQFWLTVFTVAKLKRADFSSPLLFIDH
jgi:hypothetical protein